VEGEGDDEFDRVNPVEAAAEAEVKRFEAETKDLLFYTGFLEKEVVRETSLEMAKFSARPPARPPQMARPPPDQRTVRPYTRARFSLA